MWEDLFRAHLSGEPTQATPIVLSPQAVVVWRYQMRQMGFVLSLAPEQAESLRHSQFRSLVSGRGDGFVAVMHSDLLLAIGRAKAIWGRTLELAQEYGGKRIVSDKTGEPIEGTENRGIVQAIADILAIAALPGEEEQFLLRLNRRIWRGLLLRCESDEERAQVNRNFATCGEPPTKLIASVPPGSLRPAWLYVTIIADAIS